MKLDFDAIREYRIAVRVARSKVEILEDLMKGALPLTISSFSELHDTCDANMIASICDEAEGIRDTDIELWEEVQARVNLWLSFGKHREELCNRCLLPLDDPGCNMLNVLTDREGNHWYFCPDCTLAMSARVFRHISNFDLMHILRDEQEKITC